MVVFRCTQKLLSRLGEPPGAADQGSDGVLGDWYATILFTKPRWLVLCVSERTRLPVVMPAQELATMQSRFPTTLAEILRALKVPERIIASELGTMTNAVVTKTVNRSVLGTLNEFAQAVHWAFEDGPVTSLHALSLHLAETPILPLHDYPARMARRALKQQRT